MSGNIYVYGVLEQPPAPGLEVEGVHGRPVETVDCAGLTVVVSPIDTTEPEHSDEAVHAHNDVLQHVLDRGETVVPMRFGMAFRDDETLENVVTAADEALREALSALEGTVELGVKVIAPDADAAESEPLPDDAADAVDRLSALSVREAANDLFSDRLVLNTAYLVEREDRASFDEAVDDLKAALDEEWLVQYTGPWPPYNFVDIRIGPGGE